MSKGLVNIHSLSFIFETCQNISNPIFVIKAQIVFWGMGSAASCNLLRCQSQHSCSLHDLCFPRGEERATCR